MRSEDNNLNNFSPPSSSQAQPYSILNSSILSSLTWAVKEAEEWGLWSVHDTSPLPLLPPCALCLLHHGVLTMEYSPSWTTSARVFLTGSSSSRISPAWVLSMAYGTLGTGWSNVGPSQVAVPGRKPATAWDPLHRTQFPSGHVHLLWSGILYGLQYEYLFPHVPPWAAVGQPAPPRSFPQAAEESLFWCLEHLLLTFLSPWCLQGSFLHLSSPLTLLCSILPFLTHAFPKMPQSWLRDSAVPCSGCIGAVWNELCLRRCSSWPLFA